MEVMEFHRRIGLMEEAVEAVKKQMVPEEVYQKKRALFYQDRERFYQEILSESEAEETFLMYYCHFACETYEKYIEKGIPLSVYWDTFADIRLWCQNCLNEFGKYGIHEYQWFWRHFELCLFKLGRLEYEMMGEQRVATKGKKGTINIHIPQGAPLIWKDCKASLEIAHRWFKTGKEYVCHSWLLDPALRNLLPDTSNILAFQEHFRVEWVDYEEQEAEWRIFGKVLRDISQYPEETQLQRSTKKYLLEGGRLGSGYGILH